MDQITTLGLGGYPVATAYVPTVTVPTPHVAILVMA
jgi:hypothetical protein